jgi:5-methylcytosine-specific restriction enzyme B
MMRFLYTKLRLPPPPSSSGLQIWKIAPGENAKYWDMCYENGCIVIYWLGDVNFEDFIDRNAIRQALITVGAPTGGAPQIWRFTHDVQPDSIVVANKGQNTVIGVGRVTSGYIPPHDPNNPSTDPQFRHTHRIEWLIAEPMQVPLQLGRQTIRQLSADDWDKIKAAYLADDPGLAETFAELDGGPKPPSLTEAPVPADLKHLWNVTTQTRNVILYGPPGTGKTWITNHFVDYFLLQRNFAGSGKAAKYWKAVQSEDQTTIEKLQAEIRADTEVEVEQVGFWWVTANPNHWKWDELFQKGEEFFERGRIDRNFDLARDGDFVFGYEAHPTKQIVAIAKIRDEHAVQKANGKQIEGFLLEPVQKLKFPFAWQQIATDPVLVALNRL